MESSLELPAKNRIYLKLVCSSFSYALCQKCNYILRFYWFPCYIKLGVSYFWAVNSSSCSKNIVATFAYILNNLKCGCDCSLKFLLWYCQHIFQAVWFTLLYSVVAKWLNSVYLFSLFLSLRPVVTVSVTCVQVPEYSLPFRFFKIKCMHFSFPHTCCMSHPSLPPWFDYPSNVGIFFSSCG